MVESHTHRALGRFGIGSLWQARTFGIGSNMEDKVMADKYLKATYPQVESAMKGKYSSFARGYVLVKSSGANH